MKRFITAMLFSLTVIVCQQQTLFAALSVYTNVASVTADSEEGHRGIPIAGVDRLIPVAESFVTSVESMGQASRNSDGALTNLDLAFTPTGENCHLRYERLNVVDPYACPNDRIASGSNLHHTFEGYIMDPADDPNFILDDMPFLDLDSPLLPWHGR